MLLSPFNLDTEPLFTNYNHIVLGISPFLFLACSGGSLLNQNRHIRLYHRIDRLCAHLLQIATDKRRQREREKSGRRAHVRHFLIWTARITLNLASPSLHSLSAQPASHPSINQSIRCLCRCPAAIKYGIASFFYLWTPSPTTSSSSVYLHLPHLPSEE